MHLFRNKWQITYNEHNYNTRTKHISAVKTRVNKAVGQKNYTHLAPQIYDLVPPEIKTTTSFNVYKKKINVWIMDTPRSVMHRIIDGRDF